jgi:selT/selW/selH-like putative selenoprotein
MEVDHSHGHGPSPTHVDGKVAVQIEYCGGWGYKRFATALSAFLQEEFGDKIHLTQAVYPGGLSGAFEVTAAGQVIHSKLNRGAEGHGKCQTDQELDNIIEAVEKMIK